METLDSWLHSTLKKEEDKGLSMGWIQERVLDITPIFRCVLAHILDGGSLLVLSDSQRAWFAKYITQNINLPSKTRPFLPIFDISSLSFMLQTSLRDIDDRNFHAITKMLDRSFGKNYTFWYIGKNTKQCDFALSYENAFVWLMDDDRANALTLSSTDELIDFKLMQLYRIFEKALIACIWQQFTINR